MPEERLDKIKMATSCSLLAGVLEVLGVHIFWL